MTHPLLSGSHLTTAEAAALLRVSPATLKRWAQSGRLISERTEGGHRRFRTEDVRALLKADTSSDDPAQLGADLLCGTPDAFRLQGWLLQLRNGLASWWASCAIVDGLTVELERRRAAGALGAVQVEVALDRLRLALLRFLDLIVVPAEAPTLLVAAVPGDPYLVTPALLQVAAPESGWRAEWAGHPDVPALREELRRRTVQAVVVCASQAAGPEVMARHAASLDGLARDLGVPMALVSLGEPPERTGRVARLTGLTEVQGWLAGHSSFAG